MIACNYLEEDSVDELALAIAAADAVRSWRELRSLVLSWGGIRQSPDWRSDSIPRPLRRRNGAAPDELAQVLGLLGELPVETGDDLVQLAQRVYGRYLELRDVDVDPWRRQVLNAISELRRRKEPWSAAQLRELAGAPARRNALGATVQALRRQGLIRPAGVMNATRREARGRLVRRWEVAA